MECIHKCAPNFYLIGIEHFQLNQNDDNQEQKMMTIKRFAFILVWRGGGSLFRRGWIVLLLNWKVMTAIIVHWWVTITS